MPSSQGRVRVRPPPRPSPRFQRGEGAGNRSRPASVNEGEVSPARRPTMRLLLPAFLLLALPLALAQDAPDHGDAIARIAVVGMECEGACPPTVKAALEGDGVSDVKVDYAKKTATFR